MKMADIKIGSGDVSADQRPDPFWEPIFWRGGSRLIWDGDTPTARHDEQSFRRLVLKELSTTAGRLLSFIYANRICSPAQASILARFDPAEALRAGSLLHKAGLVERADPFGRPSPTLTFFRPSDDREKIDRLCRWLPFHTDPWRTTMHGESLKAKIPRFDRHGLLCVELAARLREWRPDVVAGFIGEGLASARTLFDDQTRAIRPDGVIVTRDGRLILMEMTSTGSHTAIQEKVRGWLPHLITNPWAELLFVEAAPRKSGQGSTLARLVKEGVERAAATMGALLLPTVLPRILFTRWTSWFPAPGEVSPKCAALVCEHPYLGGEWKLRSIAQPASPHDPVAVVGVYREGLMGGDG